MDGSYGTMTCGGNVQMINNLSPSVADYLDCCGGIDDDQMYTVCIQDLRGTTYMNFNDLITFVLIK